MRSPAGRTMPRWHRRSFMLAPAASSPPCGAWSTSGSFSVTSAAPDSTLQDTTLDVRVFGSGFDRGSKAQWAQSGVVSSNVTTNSTKYLSSTQLTANITVAITASTGRYDILV